MESNKKKGYGWAISAGVNAALAAISAKFFSSQLKYGLVIFFNVIMWGCYVNSMKALSSLQATVTNFATNFLCSGLAGFFLFEEALPAKWFAEFCTRRMKIISGKVFCRGIMRCSDLSFRYYVSFHPTFGSQPGFLWSGMDDSGHRENGRNKPPQGQWFMQHQPSMKQIMGIMAERDAAIQERNLALSEKKAALAERDVAILQRDSAIVERNNAIMERDNAIATLQYRENAMNSGNVSQCPSGCQISRGMKHIPHLQQHIHTQSHSHMGEAPYDTGDTHINDTIPLSPIAPEPTKSHRTKRTNEAKAVTSTRKTTKSSKKVKQESEDVDRTLFRKSQEGKSGPNIGVSSNELNRQLGEERPEWKGQDLGLNQVAFDESTMPVPVCSCTGVLRPCYKWGNGGWQSSCCTMSLSMYPLPAVPNKRHARVGGRKMSGSAFNKLLSRLAAEGYDLSNPVDLKDHWAKHGTNRYITIK
ncbi:unnamed protein product [Fraxinus pennsylvanica]|uniref:GAGA-binding transcriptional activator n=1 Tax=Fraxinus pennsylvanica TaxID=56036 RepID=A0AAD1Z6V8_9LAMI|nr:unnamed protein product [Fraxinus pennsylvanica]